jgi:hypothetical protein
MFLMQFVIKTHSYPNLTKYSFKKKFYSFLKLNEVRQALMDRKKFIFSYKLLFNQKTLIHENLNFSPSKLKQVYRFLNKTHLSLSSYLFKKTDNHNYKVVDSSYNLTDVVSSDIFNLRGIDQLLQRTEIKVPRVKFKPGYQRI